MTYMERKGDVDLRPVCNSLVKTLTLTVIKLTHRLSIDIHRYSSVSRCLLIRLSVMHHDLNGALGFAWLQSSTSSQTGPSPKRASDHQQGQPEKFPVLPSGTMRVTSFNAKEFSLSSVLLFIARSNQLCHVKSAAAHATTSRVTGSWNRIHPDAHPEGPVFGETK